MACRIFRFHDTAFLVTFNDSLSFTLQQLLQVFGDLLAGRKLLARGNCSPELAKEVQRMINRVESKK